MRRKLLVSAMLLLVLTDPALPRAFAIGVSASGDCILLVDGSESFLSSYADGLHAVFDLLPVDLEVGLMLTGQPANMQMPAPLSRTRRAELHAFLEWTYPVQAEVLESEWEPMLRSAIDLVASRGRGKSSVVVLHSSANLPTSWQELVQIAAERGVLLYELDLSAPQVREVSVRERRPPDQIAKGGLARLPELLGLTVAEFTTLAYGDTGMQLGISVPAGVSSLIFQWDHFVTPQVLLTTPSGDSIDPMADAFQPQLFTGPNYTSFHLDESVLPEHIGWQGQWKISASSSIGLGVWFNDPAWLQPSVREIKGQRIVSLATNWNELLPYQTTQTTIALHDWRGKLLAELNDLGINGDGVAGDGIYSAVLPRSVSAGPAIIKVSGSEERMQTLVIPAASPAEVIASPSGRGPIYRMLIAGLGLTMSGFGMLQGQKKKPTIWRVSHLGVDGYWHNYDFAADSILAGSGEHCQIRLARNSAFEQIRLRQTNDMGLRLDVLAAELTIRVNDEKVYLGKWLEHGDRITIAGETLLVEKLACLRVGKHCA